MAVNDNQLVGSLEMKIIGTHTVETIEHMGEVYERSSEGSWNQHIGESMEAVHAGREERLESEYQSTFYRRLEYGEIIQQGDEIDGCGNPMKDWPVWEPAGNIGEPAPDPKYPSHRQYRRRIKSN